jgi:hypothetical protein
LQLNSEDGKPSNGPLEFTALGGIISLIAFWRLGQGAALNRQLRALTSQ